MYKTGRFGGSIGKKITFLFLGISILFIIFSGVNQAFLYQYSNYYFQTNQQIETIRDIGENIQKSNTAFSQFLRFGNSVYKEDYLNLTKNIYEQLEKIEEQITYEEAKYLLPGIVNLMDAYQDKCFLAMEKYQKNDYSYYEYVYDIQKLEEYLNSYCNQMLQLMSENATNTYYDWEAKRQNCIQINVGFFLVLVASSMFIISFINVYITKPMNRLAMAAKKVAKGDFDVEVPYDHEENEINLFCSVFNQMVKSISKTLQTEKEKTEAEKQLLIEKQKNEEYKALLEQAKFLALQSQTNPHFMFNTLNSIKSTVMLGKNKEAIKMLSAFATFIRYSLKSSENAVQLEEEIGIVREYLSIQQIRFGDRIQMGIKFDNEVAGEITIPRFTIQPLVENALIHGLEKKVSGGILYIDVKKRLHSVDIRIFDNGAGMTDDKITQIRKQQYIGEKRIGIDNIQNRLRIYFREKSIFHIISKEGIGTLIVLRIPREEEIV